MSDEQPTVKTLLQRILDGELGARARSLLLLAMAVVTAVLLFLQSVLEVLHSLPSSAAVGRVALLVQAVIVALARFTTIGNTPKG